jgi:hypothetical protein
MRRSAATAIFWLSGPSPAGERRELLVRVGRGRSFGADRLDSRGARRTGSGPAHARNPKIPLPRDLYAPDRRNSSGVEFGDRASLDALLAESAMARCRTRRRR